MLQSKISNKTIVIFVLVLLVLGVAFIPFPFLTGKQSILGAVTSRVFVKGVTTSESCTINLTEGWNLMSVACVPENTSITSTSK